jgi:hypothetical protein
MMFNATFNNISVISWRSVLLVEETGAFGEIQRPVESLCQSLSQVVITGSHDRHHDKDIYTCKYLIRYSEYDMKKVIVVQVVSLVYSSSYVTSFSGLVSSAPSMASIRT